MCLRMLEILSHGIQISNFSMGAYSQTPSRSVLLCNMPCLLCKHNFHSATYSVQIIHLLHSLMTTLHYIIFFIWSNPQNKLFVIKMLHDPSQTPRPPQGVCCFATCHACYASIIFIQPLTLFRLYIYYIL